MILKIADDGIYMVDMRLHLNEQITQRKLGHSKTEVDVATNSGLILGWLPDFTAESNNLAANWTLDNAAMKPNSTSLQFQE